MHKQFIKACDRKMKQGEEKYGELNIDTDPRDWFDEMKSEVEDIGNYAAIQWEKLDHLQKKFHDGMRRFND